MSNNQIKPQIDVTMCENEKWDTSPSSHSVGMGTYHFPKRIPKLISIEGNIGAGKSTLFQNIQNYIMEYQLNDDKHIVFLREPVDIWEGIKDTETNKSVLEMYYENPSKQAFSFQIMVLASQIRLVADTVIKNPLCSIIISERSIDAGHNVFTKMLVQDGFITPVQYQIYQLLFDNQTHPVHSLGKITGQPNKIIYLDVEPEICKKRIQKRCREGETNITIEYLNLCKKFYDEWLVHGVGLSVFTKDIIIITDNNDIENIINHFM